MKTSAFRLLSSAFVLALALTACGQPYTFHGTLLEPPLATDDFALVDQNGQATRLSDYNGQLVLLFFGYADCPDACPATLAQFKQIRAELGDRADRVSFVLITVDPERDTPERLKEYLAQFDPSFVGLTGSAGALQSVYREYGVSVQPAVTLAHTSSVFLLDREGRVQLIYTDIPWQDTAADLRHLLDSSD